MEDEHEERLQIRKSKGKEKAEEGRMNQDNRAERWSGILTKVSKI